MVPEEVNRYWETLSKTLKFCIAVTAARNDLPWPDIDLIYEREKELPLKALLHLLIRVRQSSYTPHQAFLEFHSYLQDLIVRQAWQDPEPIDVRPLLPPCAYNRYLHCEAQHWEKMQEQGTVWCRDGKCTKGRMDAQLGLSMAEWGLPEIMAILDIEPSTQVVTKKIEYVTRLGGWVNRLNDIRERMKCRTCSKFMRPHRSYSKNLARYHATVMQCTDSGCRDFGRGVYLSHCWACSQPIDSSRETPIQREDRYLCANCGSGPRESEVYSQGDCCPACGSDDMHDAGQQHFVCRQCSHSIALPPRWALTGPRWMETDEAQMDRES